MDKPHNLLCLLVALIGTFQTTFAQKVSIQLGAFTEPVSPSFFNYAGFTAVNHDLSTQQFHQYTWGNFKDVASAAQALAQLRQKTPLHNLTNLKIVPIEVQMGTFPTVKTIKGLPSLEDNLQLFSRAITFNKDNFSISTAETRTLEEIRDILHKNPELKLRIIATDQGQKQATATNMIKNFLLANQIPAYRIKIIPPTKNEAFASTPTIKTGIPPVIMTLVDLKEEIVLDRFNADRLFVKDVQPMLMDDVLE